MKIGVIFLPGASGGANSQRFKPFYDLINKSFKIIPWDIWDSKSHLSKLKFESIFEGISDAINNSECDEIILVGKSFGGGIFLKYTHPKVIGKILWSPAFTFSDEENFNLQHNLEFYEKATNIKINLQKDKIPNYILHGTNDDVISHTNSQRICSKINATLLLINGANHSFSEIQHSNKLFEESSKLIQLISDVTFLNKEVEVIIDRPLGSKHPKWGFEYLVNYGYVPNTISGDDEELDVYILGVSKAIEEFQGKCIALVQRLDDCDNKLIVVPKDIDFSDEEIEKAIEFQEKYFKHKLVR
jgi:inorganic pyrophosphatase